MQQDGKSLYEHLKFVEKVTGKKPPELVKLEQAECPRQLVPFWVYFLEISARRTTNGFGYNPISYVEIKAWCDLTGFESTQIFLDCLTLLDSIWLSEMNKGSNDG